jgi:hypothetical protein
MAEDVSSGAPSAKEDLLELVAPGGVDEANHGTIRYRVDNNGRVRVPFEAAHWLVRKGGFRVADARAPIITSTDPGPRPEIELAYTPAPAAAPAKNGGSDGLPARSGPPRPRKGA